MKLLYYLLALFIFLAFGLTIFELLLYNFHSPFNQDIPNPKAHTLTWIYLLKQKYITFIDLDIFSIHEKRHLLDVKRLFEKIYTIWLIFTISSVFITIFIYFKGWIGEVFKYFFYIGVIINSIFIIFSLFFIDSFNFLHKIFFPKNSWIFPPDSILIEWFPISYFVEFFILFIALNFLGLFIVKKLSNT